MWNISRHTCTEIKRGQIRKAETKQMEFHIPSGRDHKTPQNLQENKNFCLGSRGRLKSPWWIGFLTGRFLLTLDGFISHQLWKSEDTGWRSVLTPKKEGLTLIPPTSPLETESAALIRGSRHPLRAGSYLSSSGFMCLASPAQGTKGGGCCFTCNTQITLFALVPRDRKQAISSNTLTHSLWAGKREPELNRNDKQLTIKGTECPQDIQPELRPDQSKVLLQEKPVILAGVGARPGCFQHPPF